MELYKRTICTEDLISRAPDITYGTVTAHTISFNIFLTQDIENMGLFTDVPYEDQPLIESYSILGLPNLNNVLVNKLYTAGFMFPFMTGATATYIPSGFTSDLRLVGSTVANYTGHGGTVTGVCESKIGDYRGYLFSTPYPVGHAIEEDLYYNYAARYISGVSMVTSYQYQLSPTLTSSTYVKLTNLDSSIGTPLQNTGILYNDYNDITSLITPKLSALIDFNVSKTTYQYQSEGWNVLNTSLSAITKEEKYYGLVFPPEVQSDIFIDRGNISVFEPYLRLAEIENVDQLMNYNVGYYNIVYNSLS